MGRVIAVTTCKSTDVGTHNNELIMGTANEKIFLLTTIFIKIICQQCWAHDKEAASCPFLCHHNHHHGTAAAGWTKLPYIRKQVYLLAFHYKNNNKGKGSY